MKKDQGIEKYLFIIGIIPVVWIALLIAPYTEKGIINVINNSNYIFNNPFNINLVKNSLKTTLIFLCIYGMCIVLYYSSKRNYRRKEEHGSAKWGNVKQINKKYMQYPLSNNKILSKNVKLGLDGKIHRRNLNVLVVGGSGTGKTRFYAKPNIMQCNTSFVTLDPKGELLRDTGELLKKEGYEIKVLDLVSFKNGNAYNPFVYIKDDNDVQKLVTNLVKATTIKGAQTNDPFWDTAASMLLSALIYLLKYEAIPEEQNFGMVMELILAGAIDEEADNQESLLDRLFFKLSRKKPNHIALKYYRSYHSGAAKTLESIQVTLSAKLEKFNIDFINQLTSKDEMELSSLGEKKIALFAIIPDNDTSYNFIVSILYTQLFQQLFYIADKKYNGSLPIHVHFVMDEFANVSLPDDFDKILSVMRSRNISVSIILQNLAQLKALFQKQWESIVGNCDEFLFLGGNELSTDKYVSELLGKETIDTDSYSRSYGQHGQYSTNYQSTGRELLTPDEVRMLDNDYELLFIRGERPIYDMKYDIKKHPNYKFLNDYTHKPYIHITNNDEEKDEEELVMLSNTELEEMYNVGKE